MGCFNCYRNTGQPFDMGWILLKYIDKGVEETMCLVTERCEKCKYKGEVLFGEPCCDYILIAGKSRGCPAGDECDKFEEDK